MIHSIIYIQEHRERKRSMKKTNIIDSNSLIINLVFTNENSLRINPTSPCNEDESMSLDNNSFWMNSLLKEKRHKPIGIPCTQRIDETTDMKALNACLGIRSGLSMNTRMELNLDVFCAHVIMLSMVDEDDDFNRSTKRLGLFSCCMHYDIINILVYKKDS